MAGMTGTGSPRRICGRVLLVALVCTVSVAVGLDASPALGVASHAGADHDHRDAHDGHGRGDDESAAWRVYGHDLANTRTNTDEHAINRRTVAGLTEQWSKDGLVGVSGTPAVSHGVAYFADWTGTVWAVRAATGQTIWTTKLGGPFVAHPRSGTTPYTSRPVRRCSASIVTPARSDGRSSPIRIPSRRSARHRSSSGTS